MHPILPYQEPDFPQKSQHQQKSLRHSQWLSLRWHLAAALVSLGGAHSF